jgi:hypothetical protein
MILKPKQAETIAFLTCSIAVWQLDASDGPDMTHVRKRVRECMWDGAQLKVCRNMWFGDAVRKSAGLGVVMQERVQ